MKYVILSFFVCTQLTTYSNNSIPPLSAFDQVVGKTWRAEGHWSNGQIFKQEITFKKDLSQNLITTESYGFVDQQQTEWGKRNHGIRQWNEDEGKIMFWEFDVFGGVTQGEVEVKDDNIYYHYEYGGSTITDAWIRVDDFTYDFKVGDYKDGQWKAVYLSTQFKTKAPTQVASDELPYHQIPDYPDTYNAATVSARMVDGLGFRYYWATEGLRPEDLQYRPSESSRTCDETLDHLYGLVSVVLNSVKKLPNVGSNDLSELTFEEKRGETLRKIKEASDILKSSDPSEIEDFKIIFQRGDTKNEFPFWNQLNGPLADALWHTGQIVLLRRASGKPFNSKASVFAGKLRE